VDGAGFDDGVRSRMREIFTAIVPTTTRWVVLNNGLEPFNPGPGLDMLGHAKQIVVTRDPRDVYVSGQNAHAVSAEDSALLASDNDGMNKSFLATDDLKIFIDRFRVYHERLFADADARVLRLRFEDLVRRPSMTTQTVLSFLGIDAAAHVRAGECFSPSSSAQNVGLWRSFSRPDEIRLLENALSDWLVES
jgi:hypothetical protein